MVVNLGFPWFFSNQNDDPEETSETAQGQAQGPSDPPPTNADTTGTGESTLQSQTPEDTVVDSSTRSTIPAPSTPIATDSTEEEQDDEKTVDVKLYKSPRLKGYITIILAAGIHFNSVQRSGTVYYLSNVVPSTEGQRQYGLSVCIINMILCIPTVLCHLDRITPLKPIWELAFGHNARFELFLTVFLSIWNVIAMGVETSVTGIAGAGTGQYNIYFSIWIICLTSFWTLERWWVDFGWSSFREFITSWPYRAPAWICIIILSFFTTIWYVDTWRNYSKEGTNDYIYTVFSLVHASQWKWGVILLFFTMLPALAFILIELFRDTTADGSIKDKSKLENIIEGVILLVLVLAWIPTVGAVTTGNGLASLVGNAYFFTWLLVVFLFEGLIWWIHDYRSDVHEALLAKEREYKAHQLEVLAKTQQIQQNLSNDDDHQQDEPSDRFTLSRVESLSVFYRPRSDTDRSETEPPDEAREENFDAPESK